MTSRPARAGPAFSGKGASGSVAALLMAAALAWVGVVGLARGMGAMPGTMGLTFAAFAAVWALMMTAMMLPTVAPFAALYVHTLSSNRSGRITALASGYLLVWAAAAIPAYVAAWLADRLVSAHPGLAPVLGAVILVVAGVYELTPIKDRCLARCRSPMSFMLHFGSYRRRLREIRVGISHGAFCLACCWALMAVLIVVGFMNLPAMVVLAAVVLVEKTSSWGRRLTRVVGAAALVLAVLVLIHPSLAAGLTQHPSNAMSGMPNGT